MYLGIDLGTSSVKAAVFDAQFALVAEASAPLAISHPRPGHAEQAPADWWQAVVSAVTALPARQTITAIGLSGQMHGVVLQDADDQLLGPAILWNDGRADAECARITQALPQVADLAGVRPMAGFSGPKLLWLRRHRPDVYARIAHLLLPKDYIGWRLHGARITDASDAAGTLLFDQSARQWSPVLCAASAVDPSWLPPVYAGSALGGHLQHSAAETLGLRAGLPVATGAGDTVAGAVSLGVTRAGLGFVSLGTSGQIFVARDRYQPAAATHGVHAFAHTLPGLWYHMGALLNGARPMSWFAEMTGAPLPQLLAEAERAPSDALPLCLPYLTGERTPHGDTAIRAGFAQITNDTSRGQMMRAVIDGIAYAFADAKAALETVAPLPEVLQVVGGGARADLLVQTLADVLKITLQRPSGAEFGAALGAAKLAAMATGGALPQPSQTPYERQFTPQDTPRHTVRLGQHRKLYQALKTISDIPGA